MKVNGVMAGPDGKPNGQFLGITALQLIAQNELPPYLAPGQVPSRASARFSI